jgi:hypothetical protein
MFVASLAKKAKNCRSNKFFNQNQIKTMILTVGYQNKNGAKSLRAKTWMIMKLTILLLLFFTFQVSAKSYAQKVTIVRKHATLSEVFKAIEQQTDFLFFYDKDLIQKTEPIDITLKNATLQEALSACLKDQPLIYTIVKNTIVIQPKKIFTPEIFQVANISALPPPVEIHGRVVNLRGEPIQNVTILIAGTKIGTTTDNDGRFTLTAPENRNIVLEISSVGFQTKTVKVGKQTEINVTLEEANTALNEVVVVGYGTQKKTSVTAAVSTLKGKDVASTPITNLSNSLGGRVAGVIVRQNNGEPGNDGSDIYIRGISSTGANQPLLIVDGIPRDFKQLDPNTIESFNVF